MRNSAGDKIEGNGGVSVRGYDTSPSDAAALLKLYCRIVQWLEQMVLIHQI